MTADRDPALRQAILAAMVLYDLPVVPDDVGIRVDADPENPFLVGWWELVAALGGRPAESGEGRIAVADFLVALCQVAALPSGELRTRIRPMALPTDHVLHPGPDWVRARVLGDALHLGLGVVGTGPDPDRVEPLLPGVAESMGHQPAMWWAGAVAYLEEMAVVAAERYRREPKAPLRPMGDCDVPTLLASPILRRALVDGQGMRSAAIPMRSRGWLDISRTDPAFAPAAAAAVDEADRAFTRPLLITADEVALALTGGNPVAQVLADPAAADPHPIVAPYY